jgi:hypothetical protein
MRYGAMNRYSHTSLISGSYAPLVGFLHTFLAAISILLKPPGAKDVERVPRSLAHSHSSSNCLIVEASLYLALADRCV